VDGKASSRYGFNFNACEAVCVDYEQRSLAVHLHFRAKKNAAD
jgi:hypothetical protein